MEKKLIKLGFITVLTALVFTMAGCGTKKDTDSGTSSSTASSLVQTSTQKESNPVTIKFLSNQPDRTANQGKLEQMLMDNYTKENPNVKIEVEALQDATYEQKFKAYSASNSLPDMFFVWGITSLFKPVVDGGFLAELNPQDYEGYDFLPNSTDGFYKDGKLYALPKNTDMFVLYYNKKIFDDNGVKVPTTFQELINAAKAFRSKGITPCSVNGKDRWLIADMLQELTLKASGDSRIIYDAIDRKTTFSKEPSILKGAQMMKELFDNKFYQNSFNSADYGAAQNLFAQGKSAMYYMGSWEMGMATNESLPKEFRDNLHVTPFPALEGTAAKLSDLFAFNGSGYAVSASSSVKEDSIKFLNYIFKPENWAKNAWQMGVCFPAQKFDNYLTGNETNLQLELVSILGNSSKLSGVPWIDYTANAEFKESAQDLSQKLSMGMLTPEEYLEGLDKAATK